MLTNSEFGKEFVTNTSKKAVYFYYDNLQEVHYCIIEDDINKHPFDDRGKSCIDKNLYLVS